ncbi:MAG: dTMP kinase [Syntrophales bacterium]|jgi:dTMP kinase|nr:dTMP kinase [Syntrophales bacterium]MDY0043375.1 dTMP kinase [Syntrophales bacterium]
MALFITFEGVEGSGKTTQIKKAGNWLRKKKVPCLVTSEPGGSKIGRELRKLLLEKTSIRITARTELLLFAADRAQHVEEVILPALGEGKIVLCDRFSDATAAYQGSGRGLDLCLIDTINEFAACSLKPDVTLLFDLPVEIGMKRAEERETGLCAENVSRDRFEQEQIEFHEKVRHAYLRIAAESPERFNIIDASDEPDAVFLKISGILSRILGI